MKLKPLLVLTPVFLVLATLAADACGEEEETPEPSILTKATPSASPSPNDPFTTDTGVLQGIVDGDYQTCESDAIVYIKDQRVDEILR